MITWPLGVSLGSTMTLNDGRCRRTRGCAQVEFDRQQVAAGIDVVGAVVEVPGRAAVLGDQEADARDVPVSPSPVAAMMIDWLGSLFRPKTAMLPMLMPEVGPKSVSGM